MRGNQILNVAHRVLHMAYMIQRMLGGKPQHLIMVIVLVLLIGGAYTAYVVFTDPSRAVASADALWDGDQRVEAVRAYKQILRKSRAAQPLEKEVRRELPRLYRRVISHEAQYGDPAEARDWIHDAWQANVRSLSFESEAVKELWKETIEDLRRSSG